MDKIIKISKEEKIKQLHEQRNEAIRKLEELHKNFRGVHHEDSASEIKYAHLMVMESFVKSLSDEIKSLESSND